MTRALAVGTLAFLLGAAAPARASDEARVDQVRALYAAAAYEEALALLGDAVEPGLGQYRVFCLMALDRIAEARTVIGRIVEAEPLFVPDASETSPRIREEFVRTRLEVLPEVALRMYRDAKAFFDAEKPAEAADGFTRVLRVIESASAEPDSPLGELKLLAEGFLALSRVGRSDAAPPRLPQPVAHLPAAGVEPTKGTFTPAVALRQELPAWTPPAANGTMEFRGAVRVRISEGGIVTFAEVADPVHPAYDERLLAAARDWRYKPALKNGAPTASEHVVHVVLKPR